MIIAVDTSIFLDILRPNPDFADSSLALLERSSGEGVLTICEVVYGELAANFGERAVLDSFLGEAGVRLDPSGGEACFLAGRRWFSYRRAGGTRERILPDFLIGAHALTQASRLLSRDRGFFRSYFPELQIAAA